MVSSTAGSNFRKGRTGCRNKGAGFNIKHPGFYNLSREIRLQVKTRML